MSPHETQPNRRCVVVLSADATLVEAIEAGGRPCAVVPTGVEAAAEVLVDPPGDLIVDALAMTAGDRALIDLARRTGASVWAVGAASTDVDLAGVRPITSEQLSEVLSLPEAPPAPQEVERPDRPGDLWAPAGRPAVARPPSVAECVDEGFVTTAEAFLAEADRPAPPEGSS